MSWVEARFPRLAASGWQVTSAAARAYNCIAWAAGVTDRWWWPSPHPHAYWPEGVPLAESLEAFTQAFRSLGYAPTDDARLEVGADRVAIYVGSDGVVTHAARQLQNGKWTSKLGRDVDIEHALDGLDGSEYGRVACVLRRVRSRT